MDTTETEEKDNTAPCDCDPCPCDPEECPDCPCC